MESPKRSVASQSEGAAAKVLLNLGLAFHVELRFAGALVYAQDRRLFLTAAPFWKNGYDSAEQTTQRDADEKAEECRFPHPKRWSQEGRKKRGMRTTDSC